MTLLLFATGTLVLRKVYVAVQDWPWTRGTIASAREVKVIAPDRLAIESTLLGA